MRNLRFGYVIWMLLLIVLSGCAGLKKLATDDVEWLKDRSNERWQALLNTNWEAAYLFELPAYRNTHDIKQYQSKFGHKIQWKAAEVGSVEILQDGRLADVAVNVSYQFALPDGQVINSNKPLKERWMKQENEWWIVSSE